MTSLLRSLLILLLAIATAKAAPDHKIDPATLTNKISITPGQSLSVSFQRDGDHLTHPEIVKDPDPKIPVLALSFKKEPEMLMLNLVNPFPKTMRLRALARLPGSSLAQG